MTPPAPTGERATYARYLQSEHWLQLRAHLLLTRGNRCEACGKVGGAQAHHLSYARLGHELPEDIILLCPEHHQQAHSIGVAEAADAAYEFLIYRLGQPEEH